MDKDIIFMDINKLPLNKLEDLIDSLISKYTNRAERIDRVRAIWSKWHYEDVRLHGIAHKLTDSEITEILLLMESEHDATVGINWSVIDDRIEEVLGER
jgi:hypothetical protein